MGAENAKLLDLIEKLLGALPEKEAFVIDALYGLGGQEPKNVHQVAEELNVSIERIRQIWSKTMARLTFASMAEVMNEILEIDPTTFSKVKIVFPEE